MRVATGLLLALLAGACRDEPPPDPAPAPATEPGPWVQARVFDFVLSLPEAWTHKQRELGGDGHQFFAPWDDDFQPNLIFYWRPWERSAEQWMRHNQYKYDDPASPAIVRERGEAVVAGMPAFYMVYEQKGRHPDSGRPMTFLTIDWYFARDGRGAILRGVATNRTFVFRYRPVFEEIAGRLRWRAQ